MRKSAMGNLSLEIGTEDEARRVRLEPGMRVSIGRSPANDLVLSHPMISASHAEIFVADVAPEIRDLGSTNGTWVNGRRIDRARNLSKGDRLVVGVTSMRIVATDRSDETAVTFLEGERDDPQILKSIDATGSPRRPGKGEKDSARELRTAHRNLSVLYEMGGLILDVSDEGALARRILDLVFEVLPAERGCLLLKDAEGRIEIRGTRLRKTGDEALEVSRTILNKCMEEGVSVVSADAIADDRFRDGKSVIMQGIRSAMCAPMRGRHETLGAIYIDTKNLRGAFGKLDLELLTTLGIQAGIAVENLGLLRQNLKAERLAAVGGVVAGLSHDIRNILVALKNGSFILDRIVKGSEDSNLKQAWEIMHQGTDTITDLVEDMVTFSKERKPSRQPVDIGRLVSRVVKRFEGRAKEMDATLAAEVDPALEEIALDAAGMDRVLSNLLSNALDASSGGGGLVVVRAGPGRDSGEVVIEVSDTGVGIRPEDRERIFDLLFSTKGSKGTGFGLAVTKKIVTEHGGTVEVDSEPGHGATFLIRLPRG